MRNKYLLLNVYKNKNIKSEVGTQLIYGDTFKIKKKYNNWIKIKNETDNYRGYIKNKKFYLNQINTHKVSVLSANLYSSSSNKKKLKRKISFGAKLKIEQKRNSFYRFDNFWIKEKNLKKIEYQSEDIFKNIKKFVNIKYKWGGKHFSGIDCSGLVQLFINFNNKYCPRDAKEQINYFKKKINLKKIKKNDLIFWKGHVAIAISKKKLIHAYGPMKKVVVMPIKKTINRIYKTAGLKVICIKRI